MDLRVTVAGHVAQYDNCAFAPRLLSLMQFGIYRRRRERLASPSSIVAGVDAVVTANSLNHSNFNGRESALSRASMDAAALRFSNQTTDARACGRLARVKAAPLPAWWTLKRCCGHGLMPT